MLYAFTGTNGHGKTLFTLDFIEKFKTNQKDEDGNELPDRQVFYFGINELKLNWLLMEDPHDWRSLPDNSIIVIDEADKHYPIRDGKTPAPKHLTDMVDHRHNGFDLFFITPDIRFLDVYLRRLVAFHKHIERKFGTDNAVILEWNKAGNPEDYHSREKAEKTPWRYNKKYYNAYKSATLHTGKRKIPKILFIIPPLVFVIGFAIYLLYSTLFSRLQESETEDKTSFIPSLSSLSPSSNRNKPSLSFLENLQPEIADIPQSAPFYRDLYQAKTFPKPNCIASGDSKRCSCYSQQGSKMQTSIRYCLNIVENGYFDPTIEPESNKRNSISGQKVNRGGGEQASGVPASNRNEPAYYPTTLNGTREW